MLLHLSVDRVSTHRAHDFQYECQVPVYGAAGVDEKAELVHMRTYFDRRKTFGAGFPSLHNCKKVVVRREGD